jgi:hypothetical protein
MSGPEKHGNYHWGVKTKNGEIYLHADRMELTPTGGLVFWHEGSMRKNKSEDFRASPTLALALGEWTTAYAASLIDGCPVAFCHWEEEGKTLIKR